jgi:hypothetical protein
MINSGFVCNATALLNLPCANRSVTNLKDLIRLCAARNAEKTNKKTNQITSGPPGKGGHKKIGTWKIIDCSGAFSTLKKLL